MLGITIFVRHHAKGVTLTTAGQRLIAEARLLLKHAEEFSKTAEALGDTDRGEITIGCFPTLAALYMPSIMLEFAERHPLITLKLAEGDQEELLRDLGQGRIEMAFSYIYGAPPGFDTKPLMTLPPVVSLAANHRLANAPNVSLTELEEEPVIWFDGPFVRDYAISLFDAVGIQPNIRIKVHSFELMRGLVARGHGYALHACVPQSSLTYDGGQVVVKQLRDKLPPAQVVSVTPGSHLMRPAVKIFEDFLESTLKRMQCIGEVHELESTAA
jgi:DNA-binding transcriptional LysR family regulator